MTGMICGLSDALVRLFRAFVGSFSQGMSGGGVGLGGGGWGVAWGCVTCLTSLARPVRALCLCFGAAVCPHSVYWSDNGEIVVLACETSFYVLRYNKELVQKHYDQGIEISDQGMLVHLVLCQ
jgi:hypothetical protein